MSPDVSSDWQRWMRSQSEWLEVSFRASQPFRHSVTKGESREQQILDVLESLLPRRFMVGRRVVVTDRLNTQAPSFDGVIMDRLEFPVLYAEPQLMVAMLESVAACVEVKSSLDLRELQDICRKSRRLHSMHKSGRGPWPQGPVVSAFAYECPNVNLAFLDYASNFWRDKSLAASPICVLNRAVFTSVEQSGQRLVPQDVPRQTSLPALLSSSKDSLLVYFYLLSRGVSRSMASAEILRTYSNELLEGQTAFHFDPGFLDRIVTRQEDRETARRCFKRKGEHDIRELYASAKSRIGVV